MHAHGRRKPCNVNVYVADFQFSNTLYIRFVANKWCCSRVLIMKDSDCRFLNIELIAPQCYLLNIHEDMVRTGRQARLSSLATFRTPKEMVISSERIDAQTLNPSGEYSSNTKSIGELLRYLCEPISIYKAKIKDLNSLNLTPSTISIFKYH